MKKKITAFFAVFAVMLAAIFAPAATAMADTQTYVSLGADLTAEQRATVLSLLEITEDELNQDNLVTVTNADEHLYLDGQVGANQIGTRALSSCKVTQREDGYGIHVVTKNITLSGDLFENALATAGVKNADVVVAAPLQISGTAALVGTMMAYTRMNGTEVQSDALETAAQELLTSDALSDVIGENEASQLIGLAKQVVSEKDLSEAEEIRDAVSEIASELGVQLSDSEVTTVVELMEQIAKLDLDANDLANQALSMFGSLLEGGFDLSSLGIDENTIKQVTDEIAAEAPGLIDKAVSEAPGVLDKVIGWFGSAFEN